MNKLVLAPVFIVVLLASGYGGYRFAHHRLMSAAATPAPAAEGKQVLYWYDPMYPQQKFDKPGRSPFMDMQLVPKYAGEASAESGTVAISPRMDRSRFVPDSELAKGGIPPVRRGRTRGRVTPGRPGVHRAP